VIRDGGIRGVVIILKNDAMSRIEVKGRELFCGAGARLKHISNAARDAGLAGLEFLEGIPGCLGGALRMNAGAMGSEIFDVVERVRFMTRAGRIDERESSRMKAVYRSCPMLVNNIALGAVLHGEPSDFETVRINMEKYRRRRTMSQPNASSAGCMFKNPDEKPAGKLVDECGLKGISVGGVSVSKEHGNFFTNDGTASAADLVELLNLVRERVREASGIDLELEVQIVGE
jgi:UDP-N-acetylenolpyruvoylglucosamine reductase